MSVHNNGKSTGLGGITGKGFQPGQSGNPGGRPQGLAKLAREAVGNGLDLIAFYLAVFNGEAKALGVRQVTLRDRMQAAQWLAERGWGKTPLVADAELTEEPKVDFDEEFRAWAQSLPPDLRKAVSDYMSGQFIGHVEERIAEVERQVAARMPAGYPPSRPVQPLDGSEEVPE
jgi:uncharacterized protein DUF5681